VSSALLGDWFGVWELPIGASEIDSDARQADRLPGEYLYLDDERVLAYLGQLRGGVSASEERSMTSSSQKEAKLGVSEVVQIGGTLKEERTRRRPFHRPPRTVTTASRANSNPSRTRAANTIQGTDGQRVRLGSDATPAMVPLRRVRR
jgi:hypothetical protein